MYLQVNFKSEKGESAVYIPHDIILQVARNKGTYTRKQETTEADGTVVESDVEDTIDYLTVTLKEKVEVPVEGKQGKFKMENLIYTITDPKEIENVLSQL